MKELHGDDYQGAITANFSSNIWYGMDHSPLCHHLSSKLPTISRYPEQEALSLKKILAQHLCVDLSSIAVGNGSTELIYLLATVYRESKTLVVIPTFSEYRAACLSQNHSLIYCTIERLNDTLEMKNPSLVWICRPNNPDGSICTIQSLEKLILRYPETLFIVDQSYADFTETESIPPHWIDTFANLVLLHSLTKRYAIPGLRLGYCISSTTIIQKINQIQMPWSVNTLAIEAGKYLLENGAELPLKDWLGERDRLMQEIDQLSSLQTVKSNTPFFLIKMKVGKAANLKRFLIDKALLVRDATSFEGLTGEYIRINTLSKHQNNLLLTALTEWNSIITQ